VAITWEYMPHVFLRRILLDRATFGAEDRLLQAIAADRVAAGTGRPVSHLTPADIAPYWRRVVELNRSRLRSGNVSLVYPGETVDLPPF
jgi:hypothetical protein